MIIKKVLLPIFYFLSSALGLFKLFYWINKNKKIVLTYHNIIPDSLFDHTIHLDVSHKESIFCKHLQLLKKRKINAMITFDDGYKNQKIAGDLLLEHGLKGVFFISFKAIIDKTPLIIDQIMQWISYVPDGSYSILNTTYAIASNNRNVVLSSLYETLLKNSSLWNNIIESLDTAFSFNKLSIPPALKSLRFNPMTSEDISALRDCGHLIASHSWDHRPLSTLSQAEQEKDFTLSRQHADQFCNTLLYSYPYGGLNEVSETTAQLCRKYGFLCGFLNISVSPNWKDVASEFKIPRMSLPSHSNIRALDAKLSGFEFFVKRLILVCKKMITSNG